MKNDFTFQELGSLFFEMRQIIRSNLPSAPDPNAWLRFETLRYIADAGQPTMQDIAAFLRVKAPSATSLIANLARRGLISREVSKPDRRVVRIRLTAKGQQELVQHKNRSVKTMQKVFMKLGNAEVEELAQILRHLRELHR